MSVKEFFAFANIKIAVVEFLKQKADFDALAPKHKKPFRAHINKHVNSHYQGGEQPPGEPGPATASESDYFASDGFNSIRCVFSELCKENFARVYPASITLFNTVNMLICIQQYQLLAKGSPSLAQNAAPDGLLLSSGAVEVVLLVDELRVISFDRFQMRLPSSVQYDDLVRTHLNFYKHYLQKRALIKQEFALPDIAMLPSHASAQPSFAHAAQTDETKSPFSSIPGGRYNQKPHLLAPSDALQKQRAELATKDLQTKRSEQAAAAVVQLHKQGEDASSREGNQSQAERVRKRDSKRLKKVVEQAPKHEGFLSCFSSQGDQAMLMSLHNSSMGSQAALKSPKPQEKQASVHMLSGSEFDELEAQLEISDDECNPEEEKLHQKEKQLTPTQPNLLSQHAEMLKQKPQHKPPQQFLNASPPMSQAIEEMIGASQKVAGEAQLDETPALIANNEAISNGSTPIENDKIQRRQEQIKDEGRVDLPIELTDEQRKQQESLSFGTTTTPQFPRKIITEQKTDKKQGQQGVQRFDEDQKQLGSQELGSSAGSAAGHTMKAGAPNMNSGKKEIKQSNLSSFFNLNPANKNKVDKLAKDQGKAANAQQPPVGKRSYTKRSK